MTKGEKYIAEFERLEKYLLEHDKKAEEIKKSVLSRGSEYYGITKSMMMYKWHAYVSLEVWEEKLIERTFIFCFFKERKKEPIEFLFVEALRKIVGNNYIHESNTFYNGMCGNRMNLPYLGNFKWWVNKSWKKSFSHLADEKYDYETLDPYIDQFNLKYCMYDSPLNRSCLPRIKYLSIYQEQPKIELLVKSGYSHLITETRRMNLKGKTIADVLKVKNESLLEMLKSHVTSLSTVQNNQKYIDKYKFSGMEELSEYYYLKKLFSNSELFEKNARTIVRYVVSLNNKSNSQYYSDYRDYINAAIKLNINLEEKKHLCPPIDDFMRLHDEYISRVQKIENMQIEAEFNKVTSKIRKLIKDVPGIYTAIVPENAAQIKEEGKVLQHCVGTYVDRVIKGETAIVFIRKRDEIDVPLCTVEITKKTLVQARGYKNNVEEPLAPDIIEYINDLCRKSKIKNHVFA